MVEVCDTPGVCSIAAKTAGGTTRFNVEPAMPTMDHYINVLHILFCIVFAGRSRMLIDPQTLPDHVTSYDQWACAQTSHALPCGNAVGQCNAVRSNLYHWTSQHDANVVQKHQNIVKNIMGFPKASRHLLKRQGKKLKRHGAVTLRRFGGNPANRPTTLVAYSAQKWPKVPFI